MERQGAGRLTAVAAIVAVVMSACAPGAAPTTGSNPVVPTGPAPRDATASVPALDCPNYVDVVETGPLPPDAGENGPVPQAQQRLANDIETAVAYGAAHPDEFASVRFENAPRVRIVIGFTDHIDVHCAALRAILEYPDEFEVIRQPKTASDVEQIQQAIVVLAGPKLRSTGIGAETIDVGLRADGEAIAEQIRAEYGDLVKLTVGLQAYPPGRAPDPDCTSLPGPLAIGSPFTATLKLLNPSVRSGEDFKGTATVTNKTDAPGEFESGEPVTAFVYRAGTDQVVGAYEGGIAGVGVGGTLGPGESIDVQVIGGTASCLPDLGYALPPGDYDVRAAIDQYDRTQPEMIVRYLLSAPATLTVTP
jgi:hypothetical protein